MTDFIPIAQPALRGNEEKYILEAVRTGWISSNGKFIKEFETKIAEYLGVPYALAVSNGTCAIHLALLALGIGPGDEVIVPNLSFVATASPVKMIGAKPVFVDVRADDWNIDPTMIKEKITPKTKAIIPVHLYGKVADMDAIKRIAEENNLYIIEDAAEALGASYKGKMSGSLGHIGCFSLFGNKVITSGEGGVITFHDEKLYNQVMMLRDHGMSAEKRYWHSIVGYNYRMTNLQAAIGLAQLEKLDEYLKEREEIANEYLNNLQNVHEIEPFKLKKGDICWMYNIIIKDSAGITRDELVAKLKEKNIDSRPVFYPINAMEPYRDNENHEALEFINTYNISNNGLSLPTWVGLDKSKIQFICDNIKSIIDEAKAAKSNVHPDELYAQNLYKELGN